MRSASEAGLTGGYIIFVSPKFSRRQSGVGMRKDTRASGRLIREAAEAKQARLEAEGWMFPQELRLEGHLPLVPGRRFQIRGRRGWWRFSEAAISSRRAYRHLLLGSVHEESDCLHC